VEMLSSPGVLWMKRKPSMMWMWIYWMKLYCHGWISFISLLYRILFGADWTSVNYHGCSHCIIFMNLCLLEICNTVGWKQCLLLFYGSFAYGIWSMTMDEIFYILKDFFLVEISNSVWMKPMSIF
jgi:hypothetical protein